MQLGKNELLREGRKKQRVELELKQTKDLLQATENELKTANDNLEAEKVHPSGSKNHISLRTKVTKI